MTQAESDKSEKVATNGDTVAHPSAAANENEQVEPHPSNDSSATPEPHPPTLTNGIDHSIASSTISEEEHVVPNEGHSDLTSMVNGRCSPLEKQEGMTKPTSTEQEYSGKELCRSLSFFT